MARVAEMADYLFDDACWYTSGDTWARPMENGHIQFGISDFAQKQLKEIVYLDLPQEGDLVVQADSLGEIESRKALSQLISPVSGTVVEINQAATDDPALLNRDSYVAGWILKIACPDWDEQKTHLLNAEEYKKLIEKKTEKK